MKRMVASAGYGRARFLNGLAFAGLGGVIVYRTIAAIGLTLSALPGIILGAAMIGLGIVRLRANAATRAGSAPAPQPSPAQSFSTLSSATHSSATHSSATQSSATQSSATRSSATQPAYAPGETTTAAQRRRKQNAAKRDRLSKTETEEP